MIVLVLVALAAALIAIVVYAYRAKQKQNTPEDLRGDWWPQFEAEFRNYARQYDDVTTRRRKGRDSPVRQHRSPRGREI